MKFEATKLESVQTPRFHHVGDYFTGVLLYVPEKGTPKQKFGGAPGEIDVYADGKQKVQWVYDFQLVEESEHPKGCHFCTKMKARPAGEVDVGHRRLFANFAQHKAIQKAFQTTSQEDGELSTGGQLTLTYSADNLAAKKENQDAPKLFTASYINPEGDEEEEAEAFLESVGGGPIPWKDQSGVASTDDPVSDADARQMLDVLNGKSPSTASLTLPSGKTLSMGDVPQEEPATLTSSPTVLPRKRVAKVSN